MSWWTWALTAALLVQTIVVFHALDDRARLAFVAMLFTLGSLAGGFVRAVHDRLDDQQDCAQQAAELGPTYRCVIKPSEP